MSTSVAPPPPAQNQEDSTSLLPRKLSRARPLFEPEIVRRATRASFAKLNPITLLKNPVMFVVEVGAALTTAFLLRDLFTGAGRTGFQLQIALWLWFTVLFANFAEAMAEARGKAQADTLRKSKADVLAKRLIAGGKIEQVPGAALRCGDVVICDAGDLIPGDGEVIEGIATVDESVITGESAPVIRESGGDRSAVTGGTKVLSDQIKIRITSNPGETFLDRMIALVEGAQRQKTPNELALNILIAGLTLIFLLAVVTLQPYAVFSVAQAGAGTVPSVAVLVSLLVCLIPTTIGGLLSAIGIAGMDRVMQHSVLAMSGKAVEAAGDVNSLLLDKTGTITLGNRQAVEFLAIEGVTAEELADAAQLSSLADETPEGRSIVVLAKEKYGLRGRHIPESEASFIPFSAYTRMSGVDFEGRHLRKGATDAICKFVTEHGGEVPCDFQEMSDRISRKGGTPLAVCDGRRLLGIIHLKDIVKGGMKERIAQLRRMGIRSVMITGDNPLTAAAIAAEAGVDDFLAQATPKDKLEYIKKEQAAGRLVAMTGDGTNDAPALAQADVGVAMNTGTMAAKEAGNMVDLDSNPTKLIEIVAIGKQLLITRGALTTFSIANDVAKYFAIIPAMFMTTYPALARLNIMGLHTPQSAVLAAVIFNALILIALVPLALRGVKYRPLGAADLLRRNLLIYGIGGIIAPFPGIWAIDQLLALLHLA
ncbi:MAG TPA: potassium-transporting ATPase subunit KdpB [Bryobacterales bacterium]|nr:potassium-transporting ATPase subunit KdpB [Bryobacterales bacterium]